MAKKKKKCVECPPPAPIWLTSWGDMTTLMLTFFVIIIGKPTVEQVDLKIILSTFQGSLGFLEGGQTLSKGKMEQMGMNMENLPAPDKGKNLGKAISIAMEIFKPEIAAKKIQVSQDERGIVISMIGENHFPPGSAHLTDEAKKILFKIGKLLRTLDSYIRIEGHTDETPVARSPSGERYETNWELSSQRSINVLRFLDESEDVEPSRMSAVSFGKYRPLVESNTPEGRSINRRVDIVILTDKQTQRDYNDTDLPSTKVPGTEWQQSQ